MLSFESIKGVAITPALLLSKKKMMLTDLCGDIWSGNRFTQRTKLLKWYIRSNSGTWLSLLFFTYIKRFNGRPDDLKSEANFFTDANELRSNSIVSTLAAGISLTIVSLTSFPAAIFLTAMITWTPRKARTRLVSDPIPLDAPANGCSWANQILLNA